MPLEYIDKGYRPTKKDLVCEYYIEPNNIEPNKISIEQACEHIAGESSIGTWTDVTTMSQRIARLLKPHVYSVNKKSRIVKIAYPQELFEPGNMPQVYSAIAGNIFGMKALKNLKLLDVSFPKKIAKSFRGPRYGIEGIRKLLRVKNRPLVGTIVKPKVGLNARQHAKVAYDAWAGGLDIVKDDENLSSMSFNSFKERVVETLALRDRAEKETGERKMYMANITAETEEMLKRADFVAMHGGEYVMVDIITCGWAGLQTVRNNVKQVIHAHRAGYAAFARNPRHGISMLAIAKSARLIGVDQLHIGTAMVGKMEGPVREVAEIEEEIEKGFIGEYRSGHVLEQDWFGVKPVLAVASGGLHPGSIPQVIRRLGTNIVMQFGGGVHGHPMGTKAGATAVRQALAATLGSIPLERYARAHLELREAIKVWGKA